MAYVAVLVAILAQVVLLALGAAPLLAHQNVLARNMSRSGGALVHTLGRTHHIITHALNNKLSIIALHISISSVIRI